MIKVLSRLLLIVLIIGAFFAGGFMLPSLQNITLNSAQQQAEITLISQASTQTAETATPTPTETFPPNTPLASVTPRPSITPSNTLRPPPTLEAPTHTPEPSLTPTETPTTSFEFSVTIPGLRGLETPTPESTAGCEPREDWKLEYEVKANDAIASIAQKYGTYTNELAEGNCISDPNVIVIGQKLRVPGEAHPAVPLYECGFTLLSPMDWAHEVDGNGQMSFVWIGPRTPRNLIRVYTEDGQHIVWEKTVDLSQNYVVNLSEAIPQGGSFIWYVYPLDLAFKQIDCLEGGPWHFHKTAADPTPSFTSP